MDIAKLILEYLKVILSAPVVFGGVGITFLVLFREDLKALLLRVAKIRLPGGAEVSTPQTEKQAPTDEVSDKPLPSPESINTSLPQNLTSEQKTAIEDIIRTEKVTAYLWEYRYLNHFLVLRTQMVLDWLVGLLQATTYSYYDATWLPAIPSTKEREAIISVLETHHLIIVEGEVIKVSQKGHEYQEWRGALPELPLTKGSSGTTNSASAPFAAP